MSEAELNARMARLEAHVAELSTRERLATVKPWAPLGGGVVYVDSLGALTTEAAFNYDAASDELLVGRARLTEQATPSTPASGFGTWFQSTTGIPYGIDDGGILMALGQRQARAYNSANISISNGTLTALTFNSERFDTGAFHSTSVNTGRLTMPVAGVYLVGGHFQWAGNGTGDRAIAIRLNGATNIVVAEYPPLSASSTDMVVSTLYSFAAADYIELIAYQTSGGALNVLATGNASPEFWVLGPF